MRPIERGARPLDAAGEEVRYVKYGHAKRHLQPRLGKYCSFCERPVQVNLAVEHIEAKHLNAARETDWTNFLLACTNCNSIKGTKIGSEQDAARYLLPDRDRSLDAFDYPAGYVSVVRSLRAYATRAQNTVALVGLDRMPHQLDRAQRLGATDSRCEDRRNAWQQARDAREDLREQDTPVVRRRILAQAQAVGFWSVWMIVFRDDPQMQRELCEGFPGTAIDRVYPLPAHASP